MNLNCGQLVGGVNFRRIVKHLRNQKPRIMEDAASYALCFRSKADMFSTRCLLSTVLLDFLLSLEEESHQPSSEV